MGLDLLINGKRVEVSPSTPLALTYVANDLAELQNRQSNHSNRFKLPLTRRNREIFGLANEITSETLIPYRRNDAIAIQDGVQVVPEGSLEILAIGASIEAQLVHGNSSFFDLISEKNIRDLDLSQFDHVWNAQNVRDSFTRTEGYIYPLIHYFPPVSVFGQLIRENFNFAVGFAEAFIPGAVFVHTILSTIASEAGFTIEGDLIDRLSDGNTLLPKGIKMYPNLIIPFSNDSLPNPFGTLTQVSTLLPDINQVDFFKAIMQLLGIFPQIDDVAKVINLFQLSDVIRNQDRNLDWSSKLDPSTNPLINFKLSNYAQVNFMRYGKDELEEDLGVGQLNIDDDTLGGEKTLFQSIFSPTLSNTDFNKFSVPIIDKVDISSVPFTFSKSTKPRILVLRRFPDGQRADAESQNNLIDGVVVDTTDARCHFIYEGVDSLFDVPNLTFGNVNVLKTGLISNHYQGFENMFTRVKRIVVNLNLNQVDISIIDHRIPIYLSQFNEYFYLNKISNYINGRLTAVELIRL